MKDIFQIIKDTRKKLGLTQAAFAAVVGSTRNNIAKYETGAAMPPGDVVLKILRLFNKV